MKRFVSIIISLSVLFGLIPISVYSDEIKVITVSTADEFNAFSKACVSESYSKGLQVVLKNDIDFDGKDFVPVELFCGEFDGCGYALKNIKINIEGNNKAAFIKTTNGSLIKNLTVEGDFTEKKNESSSTTLKSTIGKIFRNTGINTDLADSYAEVLGGIVAMNEGQINSCKFNGELNGESTVGGIAGYNRNAGYIENCVNTAKVQGTQYVGGIAGKNDGYISLCENDGGINTRANESSTKIGGIAGSSAGVIFGCVNYGEVGYLNLGDNVGGIVGSQSGMISETTNNGKVFGRRCVGGIAGRFEPFSDINEETVREDVKNNIENVKGDINSVKDSLLSLPADWRDDIKTIASDLLGFGVGEGLGFGKIADDIDRLTNATIDNTTRMTNSTTDMVNSVSDNVNRVSDTTNSTIKDLRDKINSADTEGLRNDIEDVLDGLSSVSDQTKATLGTLDTALQKTVDILSDNDGTIENTLDKAVDFLDTATSTLENADKNSKESLEDIRNRLDDLQINTIDPLTKNLKETHNTINKTMTSLANSTSDISDSLSSTLSDLDSILQKRINQLQKISDLIEKIKKWIESLINQIGNSSDSSDEKEEASLFDDFCTVAYAEDEIEDEFKKKAESIDIPLYRMVGGKWVEDAVIRYSYNVGTVDAVEYGGGIVGVVGTESSIRQGENIDTDETMAYVLDLEGFVKATIETSINEGKVSAKSGYVGGISGYSNIGIIRDCIGSGELTSTDGSYIGGISGKTNSSIERSIGFASTEGVSDVGGIAGKAASIHLCYAFPEINKTTDRTGAICGSNTEDIKNNYFINEGLGGIDGADYEGKAVALAKQDMTGDGKLPYLMDGFIDDDWYMGSGYNYLPQIRRIVECNSERMGTFLRAKSDELAKLIFNVRFVTDEDEEIKSLTVPYGEVITESDIPELPEKKGFNPRWDKDVTKPILRSTTFKCEYDEAVTTISSGEEPPMILVEGNFKKDTKLNVSKLSTDNVKFDDYNTGMGYSISTSDNYNGKVTVRVRDENEKCAAIGVPDTTGMHIIDSHRDGSYVVFEIDAPGGFYMLNSKIHPLYILIIILVILILAALIYFGFKRYKKLHKKIKKKINSLEVPEWEKDE